MKAVIYIVVIILILLACFYLYQKNIQKLKYLKDYFSELDNSISTFLFCVIVIVVGVAIKLLIIKFYGLSLTIWGLFVLYFSFINLYSRVNKIIDYSQAFTLIIIFLFALNLIYGEEEWNKSRDYICKMCLKQYSVVYTSRYDNSYVSDEFRDDETDTPQISTGYEYLDYILENYFFLINIIFFLFITYFSILINVTFRDMIVKRNSSAES